MLGAGEDVRRIGDEVRWTARRPPLLPGASAPARRPSISPNASIAGSCGDALPIGAGLGGGRPVEGVEGASSSGSGSARSG